MNLTNDTLDLIKTAQKTPLPDDLAKAFTQSGTAISGLTAYDLEAPAKKLYPVITPLRNKIPRVGGGRGIQANWRAITGINTGGISAGVGQGNRGGVIATSTADYLAAYRGLGLEDYATFEADYTAQGFDDIKARAVEGLLRALMIQEERVILGGNTSVALGVTPAPTLTAGTAGALATATYSVICVALTLEGFLNASVSGGVAGSIARTNADGSSDTYGGGSAQKSANATVAVTGPSGSVNASVAAVKGAVAYAWYWGAAASEVLGAITTINSTVITAAATGTQTAASMPASDNSTNALVFDGLITQICKTGSGAYYRALATGTPGTGTALTSDGAGGIAEIETAFQSFWDNYRLSPDVMHVSASVLLAMNKLIIANGGAPLIRFNMDANNPGVINAGTVIGSYLNKITNRQVKVEVHPNMPSGTVLFFSDGIPYPLSNVTNIVQVRTRQDYYQIQWPFRSRKYEYGVYTDEVLQNYFPPAFGILTNIAA